MSRAAKLTLAGTSIGAVAIVVLVHYQQNSEKAVSISYSFCLHYILPHRLLGLSLQSIYRPCTQASYEILSSSE